MDTEEYELMYRVEQSHWWYRGMESLTRSVLDRWYPPDKSLQILDAGCGTGAGMATYLADYGAVTGFDISSIALKFCRTRNLQRLAQASVEELPFASRTFDLITSFDVLYEQAVNNDATALVEFSRVLKPGGRVLLRLPAYNWLRGQHDMVIHTARRYTTRQIAGLLRQSGFVVQHLTYANTFLFPLALAKRLAENIRPTQAPQSDLRLKSGLIDRLFQAILAAEAPFVSRQVFPYGLSVIAVGQKEMDS